MSVVLVTIIAALAAARKAAVPMAAPSGRTTDAVMPMSAKRNISTQPFQTVYMRPARGSMTSWRA